MCAFRQHWLNVEKAENDWLEWAMEQTNWLGWPKYKDKQDALLNGHNTLYTLLKEGWLEDQPYLDYTGWLKFRHKMEYFVCLVALPSGEATEIYVDQHELEALSFWYSQTTEAKQCQE